MFLLLPTLHLIVSKYQTHPLFSSGRVLTFKNVWDFEEEQADFEAPTPGTTWSGTMTFATNATASEVGRSLRAGANMATIQPTTAAAGAPAATAAAAKPKSSV
jgi:hypothetical protein